MRYRVREGESCHLQKEKYIPLGSEDYLSVKYKLKKYLEHLTDDKYLKMFY